MLRAVQVGILKSFIGIQCASSSVCPCGKASACNQAISSHCTSWLSYGESAQLHFGPHSIYSPAMFMYYRWIIRFDDEYITSNVYPESFARGQSLKMRWCKGLHVRLMSHKAGPRLIPLYDRITFLSKTLASSIASVHPAVRGSTTWSPPVV